MKAIVLALTLVSLPAFAGDEMASTVIAQQAAVIESLRATVSEQKRWNQNAVAMLFKFYDARNELTECVNRDAARARAMKKNAVDNLGIAAIARTKCIEVFLAATELPEPPTKGKDHEH